MPHRVAARDRVRFMGEVRGIDLAVLEGTSTEDRVGTFVGMSNDPVNKTPVTTNEEGKGDIPVFLSVLPTRSRIRGGYEGIRGKSGMSPFS